MPRLFGRNCFARATAVWYDKVEDEKENCFGEKGEEGMLEIHEESCIGCGMCAKVCPFTCIGIGENGKAEKLRRRCIECLHCAAICPKNAITVDGRAGRAAYEVAALTKATVEETRKLILQRRSYRHFLPKPVAREILQEALDYAAFAPSAKNEHPVNWLVIQSEDVKAQMMDIVVATVQSTGMAKEVVRELEVNHNNVVMGENATLLLAHCSDKAINPAQDTAIAMATVELFLQAQGIGTCWAGYLTRFMNAAPELKEKFALPEGHSYYGAMMIGYPNGEVYRHIPARYSENTLRWIE